MRKYQTKNMKYILLVEDDPFLVDIYSQKLKRAGFEVGVERNGSKVLKALEGRKPDLLMLDIVLPEVDGWEILRMLGQDPRFSDLKVMVFSNLGQRAEVEKGLKLGAVKYLIKADYTPSEVVEEVRKLLTTT